MAARIARWIGVTAEQRLEFHAQRGFLLRFAHRGVLHRLADVHESAGQRPTVRRILAPDEHDRHVRPVRQFDNDVRGERGRLGCRHISRVRDVFQPGPRRSDGAGGFLVYLHNISPNPNETEFYECLKD